MYYLTFKQQVNDRGGMVSKLGDFLRTKRKELGLSLREVEKACGISNAYLSMIESGKRTEPHPNILKKLATFYNLSISKIMEVAGYLNQDNLDEKTEVERLFNEAINNPKFSFGHRLKGQIDFDTKKLIAKMYKELKEESGGT